MQNCKRCGKPFEGARCPACSKRTGKRTDELPELDPAEYRRQKRILILLVAVMLILSGLLSLWIIHVIS